LVVNYSDQGLQIFLADGTFYREIRRGGRGTGKTTAQKKWLPFDTPKELDKITASENVHQLDFLIQKLDDDNYFQGIISMLDQATDSSKTGKTMPAAPTSYAAYTSIIVGKPFALVNSGWSLELSHEENRNWSTISKTPQRTLLRADGSSWGGAEPGSSLPKETLDSGYYFPVKLGDKDRNFDGLIGFFCTAQNLGKPVLKEPQGDWDLSRLYTYLMDDYDATKNDPRVSLGDGKNFPIFTPYYLDPVKSASQNGIPLESDHASKLHQYCMLIDPFLPVHAYTAILPNQPLQLPHFVVEKALRKMTAFWRIGPILIPGDVADFDPARPLQADYTKVLQVDPNTKVQPPSISLPVASAAVAQAEKDGSGGGFRYLQPYYGWINDPAHPQGPVGEVSNPISAGTDPKPPAPQTYFNASKVVSDAAMGGAATLKLQDGPYTMVEGYLQIAQPLDKTR
jgi:hypothetical protein